MSTERVIINEMLDPIGMSNLIGFTHKLTAKPEVTPESIAETIRSAKELVRSAQEQLRNSPVAGPFGTLRTQMDEVVAEMQRGNFLVFDKGSNRYSLQSGSPVDSVLAEMITRLDKVAVLGNTVALTTYVIDLPMDADQATVAEMQDMKIPGIDDKRAMHTGKQLRRGSAGELASPEDAAAARAKLGF